MLGLRGTTHRRPPSAVPFISRPSVSHLPSLPSPRPFFVCVVLLCVLGIGMGLGSPPARAQPSITGEEIDCEDGTADRYPCENVDLLSFLSISDLGGTPQSEVNDVWGWTDPQDGTEYALVGRTDGVAFVDVSTPTEPVYVGELPTHSEPSTWRDVKVHKDHAFIVSEAAGHGMQVFDLTQLRDVEPAERPTTFAETTHYSGVEAAHNIVLNPESGFAYIVGGNGSGTTCGGGLHMVNVQTPTTPTFVGCFADPSTGRSGTGYTHDAQCVNYEGPDQDYQGQEVCLNANETALNIADVTDKDAPTTIANVTYPQIGYVHQAWLTEDQRYLYVDDELDEQQGSTDRTRTLVFNVSNLDDPTLETTYLGNTPAIDHNQYIAGNYSYQANYTSGLRLLDVAAPAAPEEAAFFDTFPSGNDPTFQGAWSTYPFFERNMVLISSIGEGLFVVEPHPPPILSIGSVQQEQGVLVRWSLSATAQTDRIEVEHKPPGTRSWQQAGTVDGRSGSGVLEYDFPFEDLSPGTHRFRIRHISSEETTHLSAVTQARILPTDPYLATGPVPNPVRNQARFRLTLRESQHLRVALYDGMGRRVRVLHEGEVQAGVIQRFRIRARRRASGTYFLRVQGESVQLLRRVVVVR